MTAALLTSGKEKHRQVKGRTPPATGPTACPYSGATTLVTPYAAIPRFSRAVQAWLPYRKRYRFYEATHLSKFSAAAREAKVTMQYSWFDPAAVADSAGIQFPFRKAKTMRSLSLVLIGAVARILIGGAVLKGEAAKPGIRDEVRNQRALSMLGRINTMEAEALGTKKAYVAADELLHPDSDLRLIQFL
jgi:hypothetical protein